MKYVFFTYFLLMGSISSAFEMMDTSECKRDDHLNIHYSISFDRVEPRIVYVQAGEKACLHIRAIDNNVQLSIEDHVFHANLRANKSSVFYLRISNTPKEYKLRCVGCAEDVNAKIIVQTKEKYEEFQEKEYREQSENYRKRLDTSQKRERINPRIEKKRENINYDNQRYRSVFFDEDEDED